MILLAAGCVVVHHPAIGALERETAPATWDEVLARPGPFELEAVVSADWEGPLGGMLDVRDPVAREAGVRRREVPLVVRVGLLRHPVHGTWLVDTGVTADLAALRGPIRLFAGPSLEVAAPLGDLIAGDDVAGVLITHLHFDHVLGLPDVPAGTPIYVGAGEIDQRTITNLPMRPAVRRALQGHHPLRVWPTREADLSTPAGAVDVLGDGSLWALPTPGHTAGHTSYLALTTSGPVLFTGDASHTRWGWDHGVPPGWFTARDEAGAASLHALRALVAAHPEIRVEVGHEAAGADAVSATLRPR